MAPYLMPSLMCSLITARWGEGARPLPESAFSPPSKGATFYTPDSDLSSPTGVGITDPISQTSPVRNT